MGHRQEDYLGSLGHGLRVGGNKGKIDDAGQGREDLGDLAALVFPGGDTGELRARVPGQKAHKLQPGVPGGPVNRHFGGGGHERGPNVWSTGSPGGRHGGRTFCVP